MCIRCVALIIMMIMRIMMMIRLSSNPQSFVPDGMRLHPHHGAVDSTGAACSRWLIWWERQRHGKCFQTASNADHAPATRRRRETSQALSISSCLCALSSLKRGRS